ncbi:AAA family ATPase [Kovacikia minuta CCNUW1]|uniref:ATP-binding sensor histidine kinase n=1 Tax=Kovacikia minuta TaxID=2931930 RepID=UPI001CCCF3A9|nr:AAA family ATPase [Kovacikia minuta]UBF23577.1 AAA family ATPase [Kovacikia minuta CCNUW1]
MNLAQTAIALPGYHFTEQLYTGSRTLVYRAVRESDQQPVVIKLLKNEHPTFNELVQFRNQYTLAKSLNLSGIIQSYSLEPHRNGYALIMEDYNGTSLRHFSQGNPLNLEKFFPISLQLTDILGELYRNRIIHKDLKPANILINPQTYQIKLIDFSIASLLPREMQEIQNLNGLEGTLAYLSPEQTGRMNRGVDYRSDFYSLGVTFYELLTGRLPFQSNDPMELVHCHLAKQPIPPHRIREQGLKGRGQEAEGRREDASTRGHKNTGTWEFGDAKTQDTQHSALSTQHSASTQNSSPLPTPHSPLPTPIPEALSNIVMKLMAKNAEERYQSAVGLRHDLEKCLYQWQQTGNINSFALGERDVCDRFLIPEKLYGREEEVTALLAAFDRIAGGQEPEARSQEPEGTETSIQNSKSKIQNFPPPHSPLPTPSSRSELILVTGFSGIGKTAVVNEIHKPIVRQRGYFIKGKYDQFQRDVPFSAFVQAFRDLMGQLLSESDAQLEQWRQKILSAVGENGQVIIKVIPEVEHIIGTQPPVSHLSGDAAQNRFNRLFSQFIQVFARADHPLVIFIDDLQWADVASLKLMQLLMSEAQSHHLLFIGAYRDNEVALAHPLMQTLDKVRKAGTRVSTITLTSLSQKSVNQLIADTLSCSPALASPLTDLIVGKTQGNPFFTTQFLKTLYDYGLITFNRDGNYWECDVAQVRSLSLSEDVVEFMAMQLQKLTSETQTILKLAACVGNYFDLATLAIVSEQSQTEVAANLWQALQEGLILPRNEVYKFYQELGESATTSGSSALNSGSCVYKFLHDRIQQAAYSLISEEQRPSIHLKIGQLLLSHTLDIEQDNKLFDIVNHLNMGLKLIVQPAEKERIAQLNLFAAQKARSATAYESALSYATAGITLLPSDCWQSQYDLTLVLHELAAENAFLARNFEQMEHWAETVLQQAKTLLDRIKIYEIQIQNYISQYRPLDAIALGKKVLSQLGIQLPDQPTEADIQQEFQHTAALFAGKSMEELLNLPPMTASAPLAAIRIAANTAPAVYFAAPSLYPLLILSQVNVSIQHGNASVSAFFYASYGLLLNGILQDMEAADRASKLALGVLEKLNAREFEAKTRFILGALVVHGTAHLQTSLNFLRESYQIGLETGDIEFAGHATFNSCHYAYFSSQELETLERDTQTYSQMLVKFKQVMQLNYCQMFRQVALNLLGRTNNPQLLVSAIYDEAQALPQLLAANDHMGLHFFYLHKLILGYLFGDTVQSLSEMAIQVRQYLKAGTGLITVPIFYFYESLATLTENLSAASECSGRLNQVAENQTMLQKWAYHAPMNYLHKWHLVEAEKHRVLGNKVEAIDQYDLAIAGAKTNGYIQEAALANELAARFYLNWGKERIAQDYMMEAYYAYSRWGAKAKVHHLEQCYPQLLAPILQQRQQSLTPTETILTIPVHTSKSSTSSSVTETLDLAAVLKASQTLSCEIELHKLVFALLEVVLESAGAQKCALMLLQAEQLMLVATNSANFCPIKLCAIPIEDSHDIPISLVNAVKRNLQPVIITDATHHPQLASDPYIQQNQSKSVLCTPILHQGKLLGLLYLENNLTIGAFTSDRVELLNLLCAQAAISLENARLYQQSQAYAQQLGQSLKSLRLAQFAIDHANLPIWWIKPNGQISYANTAACRDLGCPQTDLANKYVWDFNPDFPPDAWEEHWQNLKQKGSLSFETRNVNQSGDSYPVEVRVNYLELDGEEYNCAFVQNIRDRKQAEIALQQSEKRYRSLATVTSQIVWMTDAEGCVADIPDWRAYTGQTVEEVRGHGWVDALHPEDRELTFQVWMHAVETKSWYKIEYRLRAADGSYRYFHAQGVPILAEDGSIREWIGTCTDIEDRKRAEMQLSQRTAELEQTLQELQNTQTQMVQAEKMSSLGQLVAGVAHEINNPVNFIFGNLTHANTYTDDILGLLKLYQKHYPVPHPEIQEEAETIDLEFLLEDLPKLLSSMRIGAERIQKIVASLRTFSRMDEAEVKAVDIHEGIDSTLMILQHRLKAKPEHPGIEVIKKYSNLPQVECYAGQLNQVFMNVLSNAIDALEDSSQFLVVSSQLKDKTQNSKLKTQNFPAITINTALIDANQIEIRIADNGPGMPEMVRQRLFNPFFTTKPVGKGTGMGLSISYQIVTEKHNGSFFCNSQPGHGAEFVIRIPIGQSHVSHPENIRN